MSIRTPDQRLRVFVSSTIAELGEERAAARGAIEALHLTPVLFEAGARPYPPRALYRAYLEQSDVFVGIYWQQYGWVPPDETISGLEDEFRLSAHMPRLLYLRTPAPERDPRLQALLDHVKAEDTASYRRFGDAAELGRLLADDLALLLTERFLGAATKVPALATHGGLELHLDLPVPPYRLVDREAELARLDQLLADPDVRLITLIGPGGIGKTRLALAAAGAVRNAGSAVGFVPFAAIRDPELVPAAMAAAIGLGTSDEDAEARLVAAFEGRRIWLVLDNLEQVVGAAPFLSRLLGQVGGLRLLATSREALRISGEHELVVPPLSVDTTAAAAARSPAVELLMDRAEAVRPGLGRDASPEVLARIARRLDGLPLALELAAARMRVLPPEALLGRLESSLDVLSGGPRDLPERQRTLRATIEWSHDLLTPEEQRLFARLAVFRGGAALGDVERICGDGDAAVLDLVGSLVEKSLLVTVPTGDEPRMMMLETIREYAVERLDASGERPLLEERHAQLYAEHVVVASRSLGGSGQRQALAALERDVDNLRAAVARSLAAADVARLATLAWAGWAFWWLMGHLYETEAWLKEALALPGAPPDSPQRTYLEAALSIMLFWEGRLAVAAPHVDMAIVGLHAAGDRSSEAMLHLVRAMIRGDGDPADGRRDVAIARDLANATGDAWLLSFVENADGWLAGRAGDHPGAFAALERAIAAAERGGDRIGIAVALDTRGRLYLDDGELALAAGCLRRALEIGFAIGVIERYGYVLQGVAKLLEAAGLDGAATATAGSAEAIRETSGDAVWLWPSEDALWRAVLGRLRARLGPVAFEEAWGSGRATPAHVAVAQAIELLTTLEGAPAGVAGGDGAARSTSGATAGEGEPSG
jgi:predicted ATPase